MARVVILIEIEKNSNMGLFDKIKEKVTALEVSQNMNRFVVLDVETTGLSPKSDRIVEIALIEFTEGAISKQFVSRFNPECPVGATEIHGITDADVINSPKFAEKSNEILDFINGRTIVAHNARFDLAFLRNELNFAGFDISWIPAFCTYEASRYYFPHLDKRKLVDCCNEAEIILINAHSAFGDAKATGLLMNYYLSPSKNPKPRKEDLDLISSQEKIEISQIAPRSFLKKRHPVVQAAILRDREKPRNLNANQSYESLRTALKACSISAILSDTLEVGIEQYLDKLIEFLEDGVISKGEQKALIDLSETYELDANKQTLAHEVLLRALAIQIVQDESVSNLERNEISNIAQILGLSDKSSALALKEAKEIKNESISRVLPSLPEGWKLGEPLRVGDKVVFTGCDPEVRTSLETQSKKVGVAISSSVSARTKFLVTDGSYVGNKANDAAKFGTLIIAPDDYKLFLKYIQPALGIESNKKNSKSRQVGAEDLDPAEVRAWALTKGISVSPKGRIHSDVYEAFKSRTTN